MAPGEGPRETTDADGAAPWSLRSSGRRLMTAETLGIAAGVLQAVAYII